MSISRRTALATGAAAVVTGAVTAPLAMKAAGVKAALATNGVTKIERLYADLLQARAIHSDAQDAVYEAHQAAKALYPKSPFPTPADPGIWPPRLAFEALLKTPGHDEAEKTYYRKCLKRLDAYDAECRLIDDKQGVTALDKRNDETYDRIGEIRSTLLEAPAVTIRDVLLKLLSENHEDIWEQEIHYNGLHAEVAVAVKRDLERLVKEARS